MNVGFPQNIQAVDSSGRLTREWVLFLQQVWERQGGAGGQTINELVADLPEDAGIEEMRADLYAIRDESRQLPIIETLVSDEARQLPPSVNVPVDDPSNGRLEALEALVAKLTNDIEALKQGAQA